MTSIELRALLAACGRSQRGMAKALDINERTMRYYASGELPIPRAVEYAIKYLLSCR